MQSHRNIPPRGTNTPSDAAFAWSPGDLPVRQGCLVHPLIDGRAAMLEMCKAFLSARDYILLAGWDMQADLLLVRGSDARAGDPGSLEQEQLLASLRAAGLDDEAIGLWGSGALRVTDVLGFAARRGARVGVLLWDAFHLGSHLTNDPRTESEALAAVGVDCLLDDSSRHIRHITQSLHQKCAVVDGRVAFVGGVDLTAQMGGDYDRWDTHTHPCSNPERASHAQAPAHPWHDVHTRIEGPVVADVQLNIVQRWVDVAQRHGGPDWPRRLPLTPPAAIADGHPAQVVRTIPPHTYRFAPLGIATIRETFHRAFARARRYIYIENQYLWPEVFLGLDRLAWGGPSPEMAQVLGELAAALRRGVHVAIVLPDHPNCGRRFSDGGIAWLRHQAPAASQAGLLHVYTLGNDEANARTGAVHYRPVYVHGKVTIIDDEWWMAGSANLNSRGLVSDAELNIAIADPATARGLRLGLWTEHLHLESRVRDAIADPLHGLAYLDTSAARNLEHVVRGEPLDGHVLPYLSAQDPRAQRTRVHPEHGWLDALPTGAGALAPAYAGRYL